MYERLSKSDFSKQYLQCYRDLFVGHPSEGKVFRKDSWCSFIIPDGLNMESDYFNALCKSVKLFDRELVFANIETLPKFSKAVKVGCNQNDWEKLVCDQDFGHFDLAVFGLSSAWGAIFGIEGYALVGGRGEFYDTFVDSIGGADVLKSRFEDFSETWAVNKDFKRQVMANVTW